MNPETFEASLIPESKLPPLTLENLKRKKEFEKDNDDRIYGVYKNGGKSPKKNYQQIASSFVDADICENDYAEEPKK